MSDLKDQVETKLRSLSISRDKVNNHEAGISPEELGMAAPCILEFDKVQGREVINKLRRLHRETAGKSEWSDFEAAYNETSRMCVAPLVESVVVALATGIQVGERQTYLVKRHYDQENLPLLFENKGFQADVKLHSFTLGEEAELKDFLSWYLTQGFALIAKASGMDEVKGSMLSKIWDLWYLATRSALTAVYNAGYEIGVEHYEQNILSGITKATEETDD